MVTKDPIKKKEVSASIPVTTVPTKKESPPVEKRETAASSTSAKAESAPAEKGAKKRVLEVGKVVANYTVVKLYPDKDLVIWKTPKGSAYRIERMSDDEHIKNCQTLDEAVIVCDKM